MMDAHLDTPDAPPRIDRRAARRQQTRQEIIEAAWDLVQTSGLAGLAMRDLGDRVGMKAQSIYSYFASKHDIYDAMFQEGNQAFQAAIDDTLDSAGTEPLAQARAMAHGFFAFCTSDPVRHQLLFQRTIPEFEPSPESFAVAERAYATMTAKLSEIGITDPASVDVWTAVLTGLTDQQISNDPGGDRWARLMDRVVDMTLREIGPHLFDQSKGPRT
ncbi:MAG: TetR/AcrR family transcriptional regulator [Acidimicrobiales bacterium]